MTVNNNANRVYISSNTATTMRLLWFISALLLVLVAGLCIVVVLGRDDSQNYHWDESGHFYYTLNNDEATLVKCMDGVSENYTVPSSVHYGDRNYPVKTIGAKAFRNFKQLKSITIQDSVTEIMGDKQNQTGAFSGCVNLMTIDLGNNVTRIGEYAFKNCLALKTLEFPGSVQFFGDGACQGCLALTTVGLNSNGIMGTDCFENCLNITTLKLADDVCLSDDVRRALAKLTTLSKFEISSEHVAYTVVTAGDGQCVLTSTDSPIDTVVLGGSGASVPDNIIKIADWAWGERAMDNLYIPSTVTQIGTNSFSCAAICTDAASKPIAWTTEVPVNTQAQLITFTAAGDNTAQAYLYRNANNTVVYPDYLDLFPDVESNAPFVRWGDLNGTNCAAVYANGEVTALDDLNAAKEIAASYLADSVTCLKFKVDFWNEYKSLYDQAVAIINDSNSTYQSVVDDLVIALNAANHKIATNDETVLESTDWRVALSNIIDAVDTLGEKDLAATLDETLLKQFADAQNTARFILANRNKIDDATGVFVWQNLRNSYESLEVNIGTDSRLTREISACENLERTQYTAASWKNLHDKLTKAKKITVHDLSISAVYQDLVQAHAALREADWADNLVCLKTWLSVCNDLPKADYQSGEYDSLIYQVQVINAKLATLDNNAKVNNAIINLQNRYDSLVQKNDTAVYRTGSAGIINKKSLPYFIIAVILFSGAVAAGAAAGKMHHELRQTQE